MMNRLVELNRTLTEQQKIGGGSVFLLAGIALVALLAFVNIDTLVGQVVLGALGVVLMVVGTLSLGISGETGRAV